MRARRRGRSRSRRASAAAPPGLSNRSSSAWSLLLRGHAAVEDADRAGCKAARERARSLDRLDFGARAPLRGVRARHPAGERGGAGEGRAEDPVAAEPPGPLMAVTRHASVVMVEQVDRDRPSRPIRPPPWTPL